MVNNTVNDHEDRYISFFSHPNQHYLYIFYIRKSTPDSKPWFCSRLCLFAVFTSIIIAVGVIVICVTSPKKGSMSFSKM